MSAKIWANVLIKNEDRYLWFAVSSAINFVDKILIWDTGSSDKTLDIVKILQHKYPGKISFAQKGAQNAEGITKLRQQMLEQSKCDWVMLLDGDEIWWRRSLEQINQVLNQTSRDLYGIVNPVVSLVGDLYHHQLESAGEYQLLGRKGHFNIRFINRNIPGLHIKGTYPLEGFYDRNNVLIQQQEDRLKFVDAPLMHCSHLSRSTLASGDASAVKRAKKKKYEFGIKFPPDFKFPEVLSQHWPEIVADPWSEMSFGFKLRAGIETPIRKLKRVIK